MKSTPGRQTKAETARQSDANQWESLTWNDLEEWAGDRSVSRGQSYQMEGRVRKLARSADGRLIATVTGTQRYVVTVWRDEESEIQSTCTCPVGDGACKHAVAVVAEYLDRIQRGAAVPLADADDPRWKMGEGDDEDLDEEEESAEEVEQKVKRAPSRQDDYGIIGDEASIIFDQDYAPADWSEVADALARELRSSGTRRSQFDDDDEAEDDFSRNYDRNRISGWMIEALENAGRDKEILALLETEAEKTETYDRLVTFLIEQKRYEDAQRWAVEGIQKTANKSSGTAAALANQLCELARLKKQWDVVAAHAATEFFGGPTIQSFGQLLTAAGKAGCQETVRHWGSFWISSATGAGHLLGPRESKSPANRGERV